MNRFGRLSTGRIVAALLASLTIVPGAAGAPDAGQRGLPGGPRPTAETGAAPPLRLAAADCSAAAAEAAAETGGQVLSVSSRNEGGQTVCVVTLLVPGQDGGRPRKRTIVVPQ